MKLKKILFVSAAVAAMTGVMATGALAADITAEWNAETQSVVITGAEDKGDANTILVLATNEDGSVLTEVTESDIKQINEQSDAYTTVKVGDLPAGTYEVRVGGDGTVDSALFNVGSGDSPYYDDGTRKVGDANTDGGISITDVSAISTMISTNTYESKDAMEAADANDDGGVSVTDATAIANYLAGNVDEELQLGTKTLADKTNYVGANLE